VVLIAPSILSADFGRLAEEIKLAQEAGADLIHIDVMDGLFVPNITVGPLIVEAIKKVATVPLDVHLMIVNPEKYINDFIKAGADILTVHVEASVHLHRTIGNIKEKGSKAGVSLNPATTLHTIEEIVNDIDLLLIMSVNPGFGGQSFIPSCMEKIKKARNLIENRNKKVLIEVDGGIKLNNSSTVVRAGADILVIGSEFFGQKDYKKFMQKLRKILSEN
jgi:ribulose-phosphate 3-epimerase